MRIKYLAQGHYCRCQQIRTRDFTIESLWSYPLSHNSSSVFLSGSLSGWLSQHISNRVMSWSSALNKLSSVTVSLLSTPWCKRPSRKSHVWQFPQNWVEHDYLVAVTGGLHGSYRFYMAVTGSTWLLQVLHGSYRFYMAVTGSTWLLHDLHGCYRVYMAVTGSTWLLQVLHSCYRVYMAVTGSMWLLQVLHGCYGVYMAVTGSTWLLQVLHGCYRVYMAVMGSTSHSVFCKNCLVWLIWDSL